MLIAFLTALTIVLGMRMMGAMLISSLIIFPALSSMRLFKKFRSVTISSAIVSALCFFTGVVISYVYATPTGASVVAVNIVVFTLFWAIEFLLSSAKLRVLRGFFILNLILLFATGCTKTNNNNNVVEIKEKMFISQVNDVYLNKEDYFGKTIKLEGIFMMEQSTAREEPYCFVLRYGPGCCGTDGNVGFEIAWAENRKKTYPEKNAWVEATGVLKTYEEDDYEYLYLDLSSLNVLKTRGEEIVTQ